MAFAIWIIPFRDIDGAIVELPREVLYRGQCQPETPLKIPTSRPQYSGGLHGDVWYVVPDTSSPQHHNDDFSSLKALGLSHVFRGIDLAH